MTFRSSSTMYVTPTSVAFRTTRILSKGMMNVSIIVLGPDQPLSTTSRGPDSSINLAQNDVDGANQRDDVGDEVTTDETRQRLKVAEGRWAHAEAVWVGRLPIADDEVTGFAFRRLDGVV